MVWPELWFRFRAKLEDLDQEDIHNTLMDIYPVVPEAWYCPFYLDWCLDYFCVSNEHSFNLPWFGFCWQLLLLGVDRAIRIIQAISGQLIELKAVSELISGYIFQGDIMAVMTFKTLSSVAMSQGLVLVSDMKLGHYLKIPPRSLFITQFIGSVLGAVVSTLVSYLYAERMYKPSDPLSKNDALSTLISPAMAESSWTGVQYRTFLSEGIIFGSIGPQKFFGPESDYSKILYGFAVGFCLPFIPWIMHKLRPVSAWHLVNVPLFFVFPAQVGGLRSDLITPFFAALGINYVIRSYRYIWWKKYAFVMSAAFDSGVAITLLLVFFLNSDLVNLPFPTYMLNRSDIEGCAPDYYLTCMAHKKMGNSLGKTYNVTEDSMCVGFQTGV
ncbi:hypothetical protein BCR33DRAFT_458016 [Rhizoclosmatium globosum]|uniref:OPT superfamily oligopeptide transporter n=1 Tax=Rhizoclosmatium globosum TaxID=329046 RepID=A0A1Y2CX36_9FUNG|nr:hypothetical protein BCR33DRAFT_458016 [Rhizoclosmatium globosum]|eukprot:ORY51537.1 hypothetical protein BCR33DRAFT_458016 [Rhizoclosmatium globosum]